MEQPILIRKNEIGVTYVRGEIENDHYENIIETILGVPESEVLAIDDRGTVRFIFQVNSAERYNDICEKYTGKDISINDYCVIQVDDISCLGTRVDLSRVPFSINNDLLKIILGKYGEVYKCQNYYRKFGKYTKLNNSGDRIVWMKLNEHIPQSLKIKHTEMSCMYVQYPDQPKTCNKCGSVGHIVKSCRANPTEYKHLIDIEETRVALSEKELNTVHESDADSHMESDSDNDHEEANLYENNPSGYDKHLEFECPECEHKCNSKDDLKEHMKDHTGDKTISCYECKFTCLDRDTLISHLKKHSIYKCDKCEYVSNSLQGLNGHTKIHQKKFKCPKCEFSCTSASKLSSHSKKHTGDDIASVSTNTTKRGLSISPEGQETSKKIKYKPQQNK